MRNVVKNLAALLALSTIAFGAQAVNWGVTASLSTGNVEERGDDAGIDGDIDFYSIGLTLDTGLVDRIFNYRGTLAYINGDIEGRRESINGDFEFDFDGLTINNSFGFRVGGSATQRFWFGPALDIQFVDADEFDDGIGIAIGPSFGFDSYNKNGGVFSLEAGYRRNNLTFFDVQGDFSFNENGENGGFFFTSDDLDLRNDEFFIRATVFF